MHFVKLQYKHSEITGKIIAAAFEVHLVAFNIEIVLHPNCLRIKHSRAHHFNKML